mgnify:CR=1 FL=1
MSLTYLEKFQIPIGPVDTIIGDLRYPYNLKNSMPVVIIIHGFTGHKDWGFLPYLADKIASTGFISIVINFSTDLVDPFNDLFTDVDKFSKFTISKGVKELSLLIENICNKSIFSGVVENFVDTKRIFLIGQSLGGAISMIYASENNFVERICLIGSVGTLFRYTQRQVEEWKRDGTLIFTNSRTGQKLKLDFSYYSDIVNNNYNLVEHLAKINVPVLIIHGSEDLTVPLKEIQNLIDEAKNPMVKLVILPRTNHTFGVEHNLTKPTETLEKVIQLVIKFFNGGQI